MGTRVTFRVDKIYRGIGGLTDQDARRLRSALERVASKGTRVTCRPRTVQLDATNRAGSPQSADYTIESPSDLDKSQVKWLLQKAGPPFLRFSDLELEKYNPPDTPA